MNRDLPPFPAVRAFEAAARHLSFKRAAGELGVTQSAISHQVKALESFVGARLFRRAPQGVSLTRAGATYLPVLGEALDRIAGVTERLRATDLSGSLTVSASSAVAARWIVPRLDRFAELYPDIDVRISTSSGLVDFARDEIDIAVRYGHGDWPGLRADRMFGSPLFPVCGPALRDGDPPLREPADLRHHTLLHHDLGEAWEHWLKVAGVNCVDAARGPRFDDCNLMLQAASEGQGVALTFSALVAPDMAAGKLVTLFDVGVPAASWYYVVYPQGRARQPKIVAFRDWLLDEAVGAAEAA